MPRALQTAIWSRQAQWMLEQSRARFGDMFTLKIAYEGDLGDGLRPGAGQAGLHRRPEGLPRRRGQPDPAPDPRRQLGPASSTRSRTSASASCCCRPSTASACRATARRWPRSPPARSRAGPPAPPTSCGRGCRRSRWRSSSRPSSASTSRRGWTPLRAALRDFLDLTTDPRVLLPVVLRRARADPPLPAFRRRDRPGRRADPRARSPSAAAPRTWPSATTSSRCWSPPATRTAAR